MPESNLIPESHSEEIDEIITAVPSWILRFGIVIIFIILSSILLMAAFIRYPDIINTSLKVNSLNAPKPVYAKLSGKLVDLLLPENSIVKAGEPIAFIESTGSHRDVIKLSIELKRLREKLLKNEPLSLKLLPNSSLGELQSAYQNFFQAYTNYLATQEGGFYQKKRTYFENDLHSIKNLRTQILVQQKTQKQEYNNAQLQYDAYKKLLSKNVISKNEFREQENKYLSGKYPLQQTKTELLNNSVNYSAKEKDLLDLENTIAEQRSEFLQALNAIISSTDSWINLYIISSPVSGSLNYAGIIQKGQTLQQNQELFIINPGNTDFFGEIQIPQNNMGKIHIGQRTLIKLHSYPYEQFGVITGRLNYISDAALRDSVFIAKIKFNSFGNKSKTHRIVLKNGMLAEAEIITEESSLLQRFYRSIIKTLNGSN